MSGLKVFVNLMSQPSRAVVLFLKMNNIPHEIKTVELRKGEHQQPDYLEKVNPFGKVPAIIDDDKNIIESIAILRYLSRKHKVPDHWYPEDIRAQLKVDEFLEWHHIGLRGPIGAFTQLKFFVPILTGEPPSQTDVVYWKKMMETALNEVESVWLKKNPYLAGEKISIADLIGICEIDQPQIAGYNPLEGRSKISAWHQRVSTELQPHYDEVTSFLRKVVQKFKGDPFSQKQ